MVPATPKSVLRPDEQEQLANLLRTMLTALGDVPPDARH
ncbi:hypothetical protein H4W31_006276 [Plantactinospora soyae]|uniref:Uncharacterized protein n=1 Tax=Plantactinospora soyae TaxID=1544732 RepID=A0A927M9H0_9ACTN|nr:hypothetical protein [Plantactinospora soyae]